jgi:hypothetical protein
MKPKDRYPLIRGPYHVPYWRVGDEAFCKKLGHVTITGAHECPLGAWPKGQRGRRRAAASIILAGDLVEAVKNEAELAVMYWWNVGSDTVWKWRKALGVGAITYGTSFLKVRNASNPSCVRALAKAWLKARDPERCAKIAAARRGKPMPPHVRAILLKASLGRKTTAKARRNMSAAQKRRGVMPPAAQGPAWTAEENQLLWTLPAKEVARRTGRTLRAVYMRRFVARAERRRERGMKGWATRRAKPSPMARS